MALKDFYYELDSRTALSSIIATVLLRAEEDMETFSTDQGRVNAPGPGPATVDVHIHSTLNRDKPGPRPRGLIIKWTGTPPEGYSSESRVFIPVFRWVRYVEYKITHTGTFRGAPFMVVGKIAEVCED